MNITVQYQEPCPILESLSRAWHKMGHNVIIWDPKKRTIYDMLAKTQPDLTIFTQIDDRYYNLITDKNYLVFNGEDKIGKAVFTFKDSDVPKFSDEILYTNGFDDFRLSCDIFVSSNHFNGNADILLFMDKIANTTSFSIKACGSHWMPSVYFIGFTEPSDFMTLAYSAKIVIANNEIEKISLLKKKIYACLLDELDLTLITKDKLRHKKTKEELVKYGQIPDSISVATQLLEKVGQ